MSCLRRKGCSRQWTICIIDLHSVWAKRTKSFTTARKRILRLVELQGLVAKCCKIRKYSLAKFANFVYICTTRGKSYHFHCNFSSKMVTFSARNINIYKICKLHRAVFSVLYNILPPNCAILLILNSSF